MSNAMRELLTEYAEEAKPYDVRATALALGRRRRTVRRSAPAALALVLLAVMGLVVFRPGTGGVDAADDGPTPRLDLPGYPATLVPAPNAPYLPARPSGGHGVSIYALATGNECLLLSGGMQYRLGDEAHPDPAAHSELSPDGRWLVTSDPRQSVGTGQTLDQGQRSAPTRLFDLESKDGPGIWSYTGTPVAWSPDSRWLALRRADTGPVTNPGVVDIIDLQHPVDMTPWRSVDLRPYNGSALVSVTAEGDPVLSPFNSGTALHYSIVDVDTGAETGPIQIDLVPYVTANELATKSVLDELASLSGRSTPVLFTATGLVLYQTSVSYGPPGATGSTYSVKDVIVVDLATQTVRTRWVLPEPRPVEGGQPGDRESWGLLASLDEGLLLQHSTTQGAIGWELYLPETRQRFLVTDLSALARR